MGMNTWVRAYFGPVDRAALPDPEDRDPAAVLLHLRHRRGGEVGGGRGRRVLPDGDQHRGRRAPDRDDLSRRRARLPHPAGVVLFPRAAARRAAEHLRRTQAQHRDRDRARGRRRVPAHARRARASRSSTRSSCSTSSACMLRWSRSRCSGSPWPRSSTAIEDGRDAVARAPPGVTGDTTRAFGPASTALATLA